MAPDATEESHNQMRMTERELVLSFQERHIVEKTIDEHCRFRGWWLHARLKEDQAAKVERQQRRRKWWTRGDSKRPLSDDENLEATIRYVLEDQ